MALIIEEQSKQIMMFFMYVIQICQGTNKKNCKMEHLQIVTYQ